MADIHRNLPSSSSDHHLVIEARDNGVIEVEDLTPRQPRGRRLLRTFLLLVVPVAALLVGGYFYAKSGRYVTTENAYVKSTKIAVSSDIAARVAAVHVRENQRVKAGDMLVELDGRDWEIAFREAEAEIVRTASAIRQLQANYRAELAQLAEERSRIDQLQSQYDRFRKLAERGIAPSQKLEEVEAELKVAQRRVATQQERVGQALLTIGGSLDKPVEEHPLYLKAEAERDEALLKLDRTRLRAPVDGIVTVLNLEPGEFVEKGEPLFALVDDRVPWVEANLKETQLTHVEVGQEVEVEVDAYPGVKWRATVASIAPATGAEFSILPPQNASGNWVKVVQRVPVKLQLNPGQDRPLLRAGMTAQVAIDTLRERELLVFVRSAIARIGNDAEQR
ncbi:MAG: HlyD family secretion protein [Minwuia sp.]|uniref:HlyD family secretion protein n=1 Tax=Minwuia sp. TaxID=2493630 RepID=UPI003A84A5E0